MTCQINCLIEIKVFLKVTGSDADGKCGNLGNGAT